MIQLTKEGKNAKSSRHNPFQNSVFADMTQIKF